MKRAGEFIGVFVGRVIVSACGATLALWVFGLI